MTSIRFSAASTATAATSIVVGLGGTPAVGDLVVVWVGVSNQIITNGPGWNGPLQWVNLEGLQSQNHTVLSAWSHTWNAGDSGSSVTFNFQPGPSLGIGDTDLSTASAVAVAVVIAGPTAILQDRIIGTFGDSPSLVGPVAPLASNMALSAILTAATSAAIGDPGASVITSVTNAGMTLKAFSSPNSPVRYSPVYTMPSLADAKVSIVTLRDSPTLVYTPPVVQEGPVTEDALFFRYKLTRYYTVLNNGGTFTAQRYLSTDQIGAAAQVFTNNAPVTSADRTNILNAGIGGDFRAVA